jgi:NADPH:quinone reductase-like Zn-dependent oxidoreductase
MQVAVLTERAFELREQPVPECGPGEVLVHAVACGICSGQVHVYGGERPVPAPSHRGRRKTRLPRVRAADLQDASVDEDKRGHHHIDI